MIQRIDVGPRMSEAAVHNGVVYLAGQVATGDATDIGSQTREVLAAIDALLAKAGTDKTRVLRAQIFLADMADFGGMNAVWDQWVAPGRTPARATVQAALAKPQWKVEIVITAALPIFEECRVTLALEPLGPAEGDFLLTADEGRELANMIASANVKLHLDCKAMSTESRPIPDILRANRDLMVHFHANDPNRQGPGFGELDFVPIFAALKEIDYRGWVSVEVFDYSPGVERLARESIENMRRAT